MKDNTFFMNFGIGLLILLGYFVAMMVISLQFTSRITLITHEMNLVSQSESYYAFVQNVQREMIYEPSKEVLDSNPFDVARDSLEILYQYNELLLHSHFENRGILNEYYKADFETYFKMNVCESNMTVKLELLPFECEDYAYAQ
jgi:hypothetical protein